MKKVLAVLPGCIYSTSMNTTPAQQFSEHFGKYVGTPHQTIEQFCDTARRRVAAGEDPYVVIEDLVEGYCLGWGSANWELVDRAARGGPLAGCAPLPKFAPLPDLDPVPTMTRQEVIDATAMFDEADCGGAFDGNSVQSDADSGL